MSCPLYVFDEHNEAFYYWSRAAAEGRFHAPADLVHADAHSDMGQPATFSRSLYPPSGLDAAAADAYLRDCARTELDIGGFISPAVLAGLVRNVYWVIPAWRNQSGERRKMNVCSVFGDGKNLKHNLKAAKLAEPRTRSAFPDLKQYLFASGDVNCVPRGRAAVLDIDLDYFACRDSILNRFAYKLEITAAQYAARNLVLDDPALGFSGMAFEFIEEDGKAFALISPKKSRERAYLPPKDEVALEIDRLVEALAARKIRPLVATVCRSRHSGFTPPEYVEFIEARLLAALRRVPGWDLRRETA